MAVLDFKQVKTGSEKAGHGCLEPMISEAGSLLYSADDDFSVKHPEHPAM